MSEPAPTERNQPARDNPNELPASHQARLDHFLGQLRSIAMAKGHQMGPWRFGPIPKEGPHTLQAECSLCGALLTVHLDPEHPGHHLSGRENTADRYNCPQRYAMPPRPVFAGEFDDPDEFVGLLRLPVGESFPSQQALLDHMRALSGFTMVGTPGTADPRDPGRYWVRLQRDADGAIGNAGFKADANGVYRFVGKILELRQP